MQTFKEGVDFNYVVPDDEKTTVGIKLLTGEYKDVVYQYGKVKFEEEDGGDIYLKFIYNVIESPYVGLNENSAFKNYIGDILVSIISENVNKGMIDETGTDYFEEPDSK